jgi:hypothetical protein
LQKPCQLQIARDALNPVKVNIYATNSWRYKQWFVEPGAPGDMEEAGRGVEHLFDENGTIRIFGQILWYF